MASNRKEWHVQLLDARTQRPLDDDTGRVYVLTAGAPTYVTLYSDDKGTSLANPITMTNGKAVFYTDVATTSVDLQYITSDAFGGFIEGWAPSDQHICVDKTIRDCTIVAPFGASNNAETSTGVILPAKCAINPSGVFLNVTTIDATETVDIGLLASEGGDADGFVVAGSVATAGYVKLAAATLGDLIELANDAYSRYVTDGTIKTVSYTGSAGSDTAAGYVVINYLAVP